MRYSTPIEAYLKTDPRRVSWSNKSTHDFEPSDNPEADNLYLRGVRSGMISRFYVTIMESLRPGNLEVTVIDRHNSNVVAAFTPRTSGFVAQYGDYEARMLPMLSLIRQTAEEYGVEINIDEDHAVVGSGHGVGMIEALRRMLERDAENIVDAQLFAEGVATAKSNQPPAKLWHEEQRRGFFSVASPALAGAGD